ncbi:Rieske 2Fe-2S domain-containing protein [bacterium]|nr:Rieske 2Fe-2S domain-containing protein [bacterium]
MSEFITVAKVGAVPDGQGRSFTVEGRIVAIFRQNGDYFAINDLCPHMGASLCGGHFEEGAVTCPWHAWRFSVTDGTWLDNPRVKTDSYPVRIDGENIQVQIPRREEMPDRGASTPT